MKKSYFFLFIFYCLLLTVMGCGSGPGAPGSNGSEDTGIRITTVNVTTTSPDIDVNSTALTRTDATMTINAEQLNPNATFNPFPANIEHCIVTYKKDPADPASPTLESMNIYPEQCEIFLGTNTCNVTLMDIQRKLDYWDAVSNGVNVPAFYPTHYVVEFKCTYMNNFGESGTIKTNYDVWLADFQG